MKAIELLEIYEKEVNNDIELLNIWLKLGNNFAKIGK